MHEEMQCTHQCEAWVGRGALHLSSVESGLGEVHCTYQVWSLGWEGCNAPISVKPGLGGVHCNYQVWSLGWEGCTAPIKCGAKADGHIQCYYHYSISAKLC